MKTLPEALRRSLTFDQGPEMGDWKQAQIDAGIEVYFCDPHAPWQRGSNENTNGSPSVLQVLRAHRIALGAPGPGSQAL